MKYQLLGEVKDKSVIEMICDVCKSRTATIYQLHSGRKLCRKCFLEDIVNRVKKEIKRYGMIDKGDKVLLALSGGKDSFTLLDILTQIHDPSRLIGLSIIEGIEGYNRQEHITRIKFYARERGVDLIVTSFKEEIGAELDQLVKRARERSLNVSPCTFCGTIRRRIMNIYARKLKVDKLATAHNLDDEAQTALINILRGDLMRLSTQHPRSPILHKGIVRKIKPLRKVYEWETTYYAYLKGFSFQETECKYIIQHPTLRARSRLYLRELEERSPGSLMRFLEAIDSVTEELIKETKTLPHLPSCSKCGEPTSYNRNICKVCELLEAIGF